MSDLEAPHVFPTTGGLCVSYRGRLLYSARDPARLPRRSAAACDRGPARLHLVFSPLLWYGLPELLGNAGPGSVIVCVEADPALAALAREAAPAELLAEGRIVFIETDSPEQLLRRVRGLGRFRALATLALSGGEGLHAELYRSMAALIAADIEGRWRNRAALTVLGRLWARNLIDNLAQLPSIAPAALPRFPGAAVVCGAGPSLEAALPFLLAQRERLSILACDTALGCLVQAGIEPDLVVCLEAQAHNLADFVPIGGRSIPLIVDLSSHPATFRAVEGPKYLSFVALAESPFLRRLGLALDGCGLPYRPMPPLGSVGVHAVHLARSLAAGPVLAAGLDFSFEAGKTHARGSPSILAEERRLLRTTRWQAQYAVSFRSRNLAAPCPGLKDGRLLLSDPILLSYAALLAEYASTEGAPLYDIRGRGPSIGAAPLDPSQAETLVVAAAGLRSRGSFPPPPQAAPAAPRGAPPAALRRALRGFLEAELARIGAIRDALKGSPSTQETCLGSLVAEADYLYWSFPDADRAPELPRDFLNRLLPELEYWSWRMEGAIATLGAS